jgi:hypothetical protein
MVLSEASEQWRSTPEHFAFCFRRKALSYCSPRFCADYCVRNDEDEIMKPRSFVGLSAFIVSAVALVPAITLAQTKSLKDQIVGTWNIVSVSVPQKDGKKFYPYGTNSKGMLVLTNDGHFI